MQSSPEGLPVIVCLTGAHLMKELSSLLPSRARARWAADRAALLRMLNAHTQVDTFLVEATDDIADALSMIRLAAPRSRRVVVMEADDLKHARAILETNAADEVLYRPLDLETLTKALRLRPPRSALRSVASPE